MVRIHSPGVLGVRQLMEAQAIFAETGDEGFWVGVGDVADGAVAVSGEGRGHGRADAGQERDGHLELVMSLPYARRRVVLEKVLVLAVQALVLSAVVYASVLPGPAFDLHPDLWRLATATVGIALLGIDFGLLAMALATATGNRGTALGIASGVAGASYLVASLAPLVSWAKPARYASLFYWSASDNQVATGLSAGDLLVLVAVGIALLVATLRAFERHDLGS